jgi:hypothetical protein
MVSSDNSHAPFQLRDDITPSVRWYGLGLLILLAGGGFIVNYALTGLARIDDALVQVKGPGAAEVMLGKPGVHNLFIETVTVYNGKTYKAELPDIDPYEVTVRRGGVDGEAVALTAARGAAPYSVWSRTGEGLAFFEAKEAGSYYVSVAPKAGGEIKPVIVAVTPMNPNFEMTKILLDASLMFFLVAAAMLSTVVTVYLLRKRNEKKAGPKKWRRS